MYLGTLLEVPLFPLFSNSIGDALSYHFIQSYCNTFGKSFGNTFWAVFEGVLGGIPARWWESHHGKFEEIPEVFLGKVSKGILGGIFEEVLEEFLKEYLKELLKQFSGEFLK